MPVFKTNLLKQILDPKSTNDKLDNIARYPKRTETET